MVLLELAAGKGASAGVGLLSLKLAAAEASHSALAIGVTPPTANGPLPMQDASCFASHEPPHVDLAITQAGDGPLPGPRCHPSPLPPATPPTVDAPAGPFPAPLPVQGPAPEMSAQQMADGPLAGPEGQHLPPPMNPAEGLPAGPQPAPPQPPSFTPAPGEPAPAVADGTPNGPMPGLGAASFMDAPPAPATAQHMSPGPILQPHAIVQPAPDVVRVAHDLPEGPLPPPVDTSQMLPLAASAPNASSGALPPPPAHAPTLPPPAPAGMGEAEGPLAVVTPELSCFERQLVGSYPRPVFVGSIPGLAGLVEIGSDLFGLCSETLVLLDVRETLLGPARQWSACLGPHHSGIANPGLDRAACVSSCGRFCLAPDHFRGTDERLAKVIVETNPPGDEAKH